MAIPERRWRCVARFIDESWQYEERDPSFRPRFTRAEGETDIRGWRPLVAVWHTGERRPWRVLDVRPSDVPERDRRRFDHTTLESAQAFAETLTSQ